MPSPLVPGEGELQLPQHWTEQPRPEGDADSANGDDVSSSTASISSSILHYRSINGRTYHSDRGNNHYWGPNDDRQNEALDIMHHAFLLLHDDKLHLAPLLDNIQKVIDIGTGTGIWAIDFGDTYPNAEVIGTDLSPIQPGWVPPNVRFQIDDFRQTWLFEENSIDYVHMRWLIGCVEDWTALFREIFRVLKPGGWIETSEANGFYESDDGTLSEKSAMAQWGYLFREGAKKMGSKASYSVVRDKIQRKSLEEAGFVNIQEKMFKMPCGEWPEDPKQAEIGTFVKAGLENDIEGMISYSASKLGWTPSEVIVYAAHVHKELRDKSLHSFCRINVAWAQKPIVADE
ncbi:methyltransferase type 12 [Grosmannia clavigera kw1407]|uniref:Methyltransferase type 12 n=1 Tax=Grosmannia clavigera (strain kw1407 / UAMH 11150) TaxID=655863 RepID=F0XBS0_GROCL|nr:methyltransferase type 12 [Grosmannia clavigera kw1407]EFX05118.1 methyltransferase type 12 [Grosmannia clavigera kw1407]